MEFLPKFNAVRTLIVESTNAASPFDFNAEILMHEDNYKYCFIKLKNVMIDETTSTNTASSARTRAFFVKSNLGQKVYHYPNKTRDFLGCFSATKPTNAIGSQNTYLKMPENPLLELSSIPHGTFNFRVTDKKNTVVDDTLPNGAISAVKCVLIFELYFCN